MGLDEPGNIPHGEFAISGSPIDLEQSAGSSNDHISTEDLMSHHLIGNWDISLWGLSNNMQLPTSTGSEQQSVPFIIQLPNLQDDDAE